MRRCMHIAGLLTALALSVPVVSQSTPQSAPPAARAGHPGPAAIPPSPVQTINAHSRLVIVDVVATDAKHTPVPNLKASDFTVFDNNAPQTPSSFEEHVATRPSAAAAAMRPLPPGIFTNFSPVPPTGSVNVLLLDALNTSMKDQAYLRDQLLAFLRSAPAGTRIAIFGLNDRLIMLQGVTSDLTLLRSVMDKSTPSSSLKLADNVGSGATPAVSDIMADAALNAVDMGQLQLTVQEFENVQGAIDEQIRVKQTLDAINQIAHYLSGISGRKNLIWFSGSFPLDLMPQPGAARPFDVVSSSEAEFRDTTELLARARVAVYPVNAAGLSTNVASISAKIDASSAGAGFAQAQSSLAQGNAESNMTMYRLASDTGGQAYVDANSLTSAVNSAIANGSNFYTFAYTPTNLESDGKFHKIQVKLDRPGVTLAYRSGYFADLPSSKPLPGKIAVDLPTIARAQGSQTTPNLAGPNTLTRVMMRGAPDATDIMLKLQLLPASTVDEKSVAPGNIFNAAPAGTLKIKPPFRRYAIDIAANARDLHITPTTDAHYLFSAEIITCVYTPDGVLINTAAQKAHGNLSASTYANMLHTGLPFHQEISVPTHGDYYLRTSVHDLDTDRYGSVEVPVAKIANLTPFAPGSSH